MTNDIDKAEARDLSLPSEHIAHSQNLHNEINIRMHQFDAGIAALESERDGQNTAFNRDEAERREKHTAAIADLDRRIEDLKRGKRMLSAALEEAERK